MGVGEAFKQFGDARVDVAVAGDGVDPCPDRVVDAQVSPSLLIDPTWVRERSTTRGLNAQPEPWRAGITHVAIDLSAAYAKAVHDALTLAQVRALEVGMGDLGAAVITLAGSGLRIGELVGLDVSDVD